MRSLFRTTVRAVTRPSPGFVRITVGVHGLPVLGADQRVKIVVPNTGADLLPPAGATPRESDAQWRSALDRPVPEAEWRARWRALPPSRRPALRTYTVAGARPGELDLDFFVHAAPGPASAWALRAEVGEVLPVAGGGVQWNPGSARRVLVAGDEAAVPALRRIAEDRTREATVLVAAADRRDVLVPGATHVEALLPALDRAWPVDYAWIAAEASQVAEARRLLAGIPVVQAQGYWTTGPR